jgi:RimJ/RimL family protein N-acetyltransferase
VGKWSFKRPYPFTHAHLPATFDMFLNPDRAAIPSFRKCIDASYSNPEKPKRYLLRALRTAQGQMIGNTDLFSFIVAENDETSPLEDRGKQKWEIAYDLDPAYWGKGLGRGMIDFLVNWAGWLGVDVVTAVRPSVSIGMSAD